MERNWLRIHWDLRLNPDAVTGYYDEWTSDNADVVRWHRYVPDSPTRTYWVALEILRPDESDGVIGDLDSMQIELINPFVPPTIAITGPSEVKNGQTCSWQWQQTGAGTAETLEWHRITAQQDSIVSTHGFYQETINLLPNHSFTLELKVWFAENPSIEVADTLVVTAKKFAAPCSAPFAPEPNPDPDQ